MSEVSAAVLDVAVSVRGDLPNGIVGYARRKIAAVADWTDQPILYARVRLTQQPDPAVALPVRAQVNLDVNGRLLRAQVAAATGYAAVDLLQETVRQRLARFAQHWQARRGRWPEAGSPTWRHGAPRTQRPPYYPRPEEEREIVAHKSLAPSRLTAADAAWEMDAMDYDFYLFTEVDTGQDSVLYRDGGTGYRLARLTPVPTAPTTDEVPMTVSGQAAPTATVPQAVARLEITGWPFVFFADRDSGRGRVLYHRYDGHYGLITPVG
ncbi:MAG TPA: sigma 54 modulation/S30EA ribosomal C-terminal domain-containing protein [Micromonosporaceae bacterium]